ncbi:MAG: 30S ribosomal protein S15 [Alphaproteobacteria bacterium CG_4_10_14_0_8_um_filter_53_9]|nr:MAG: 30S ribosomal protein S15 [Alphaproteobacteria bacterium CG_4_10_14_0_8_um_filter_53_9]
MTITAKKKAEIMKKFGRSENDTGSTEVQVAVLSERIRNLTEHFKIHKQDKHGTRGLLRLVANRRSLLDYLKREDMGRYHAVITELGLRK